MTQAQLARFRQATRGLEYAVSIANSAGLFGTVQLGCDWVRPGLALYGASPFADCSATDTHSQARDDARELGDRGATRGARRERRLWAAPGSPRLIPSSPSSRPATAMACTAALQEARRCWWR